MVRATYYLLCQIAIFFFNDTETTEIFTLSLHDALPICKVKLKDKGFPVYKSDDRFGDLYVTYLIKIPTNLTEKQKSLFNQLSEL